MKIDIKKSIYYILIFVGSFLLIGCKKSVDLGIRPLGEQAVIADKSCKILSQTRSEGLSFQLTYNGLLTTSIVGNLPDFDQLIYEGNLLKKAKMGKDSQSEVLFGFDNKGNLTNINFKGIDAKGPFNYPTVLNYDAKNRLSSMILDFPLFPQPAEVTFEYDINNNITIVRKKIGNQFQDLLVNHTFDQNKSPYSGQLIGSVLSYVMVYTLLQGDANYTYFLNKNNVTSATITNDKGTTELSMDYEYNSAGYPQKVNIVKQFEGRIKQVTESFTYSCQ